MLSELAAACSQLESVPLLVQWIESREEDTKCLEELIKFSLITSLSFWLVSFLEMTWVSNTLFTGIETFRLF